MRRKNFFYSKGVRARPPKWETKEQKPSLEDEEEKKDVFNPEESYTTTSISSSIQDHESGLRPGIKSHSPNNVLRRRRNVQKVDNRRLSLQDLIAENQSIESIPEVEKVFFNVCVM